MQTILRIFRYLNTFSWPYKIGAAVAALTIIIAIHSATSTPAEPAPEAQAAHVTLASVASLSNAGGPLPVTGRVTSVSQASLSALGGGQITSLPYKLGDRVAAGSIIAGFENSSQRAAVLQAQGSYDAALASQEAVSPEDSRMEAINTFKAAYNTLGNILEVQIDAFFGNDTPYGPRLLIKTNGYNESGDISLKREALDDDMLIYSEKLQTADSTDPVSLLSYAAGITQKFDNLLKLLAPAATHPNSQATDAQLSALSAARSGINSLASTLTAAQQSYRSDSITSTASTDAQVTIALGGLRAAQAALEKTYVRAPISGTIVSLPVNLGDFISPGAMVAIISNPDTLQVESYVTTADAKTLALNGKAVVDGAIAGRIVFIAPALDPTTGKIQVKIGITDNAAGLADGSTVSVILDRAGPDTQTVKNTITIPISAAKMTPEGPVVFTVASGALVAHPVVFGAIVGSQVTITSGLTPTMDIVTDARGLSDGQQVTVGAS